MESKSHALAAGAFVLAVLGLLIALAAWLMRDNAVTVDYEMATFDAVTGLQEQATVRYKGVAVGKVTGISFSRNGQVLVRLAISPETPVTKSTYATLNLQGVTGLSFVQLSDHEEDRTPLAAGPNGVPRIPLRPGLLSEMSDRAGDLVENTTLAVERINKLLDDDNRAAISEALAESAAAMRSLRAFEGLEVGGRIDGFLPVRSGSKGAGVANGTLTNAGPGVIRYTPSSEALKGSPYSEMVLKALEDYRYDKLAADVDFRPSGALRIGLRLEGKSPALKTDRPVHLNIDSEQNLLSLLKSLQYSQGLTSELNRKVQERYQGKGAK